MKLYYSPGTCLLLPHFHPTLFNSALTEKDFLDE